MKLPRMNAKNIFLTALLAASVAFYCMPANVKAAGTTVTQSKYNNAVLHVKIALTSKGMVVTPNALKPGNHLLTIKNTTSQPRGVELISIDKADSPTVRYTKILKPGKSESFRWYFAQGNTSYVRDVLECKHDQKSCMIVTFGQMHKAIRVK